MPEVAVVIPAYNAARTIGDVISLVSKRVHTDSIFVVDDGSSDMTGMIAREIGTWVLSHNFRKGKGVSLRDGLLKTVEMSYDCAITLDSDLQHDPEEIEKFVAASGRYDLVIGQRSISRVKMPVHRFLSNSITSRLISWRTGVKISDSQCGYRLYSRRLLEKVDSGSRYYDYESDMLIKAALAGFRIGFVPVRTIYNDSRSSIRVIDILRFIRVYLKSFVGDHDKNKSA